MDDSALRGRRSDCATDAAAAHQRELDNCLQTAVTLHRQGHLEQAKKLYLALLGADPYHFDAIRLLGMMADQLGQHDIACDLLARATSLRPDNVDALYHYALALQNAGRPDVAAKTYLRAQTLAPGELRIRENMAVALTDAGHEDRALAACLAALSLDENSAIAHSNVATLYFNRGQTEKAQDHLQTLLALRPALAQAHEKLATVWLRRAQYEKGWSEFEWRYANDNFLQRNPPRHGPYATWSGEALTNRTILVTPEQGVGDEIMFASCLRDLIREAGHVVVQCDARLRPLFARSFPNATILGTQAPPPDMVIDCCIVAGSLPRRFRASKDAFDGRPYLVADPKRVRAWRLRLANLAATPSVGVSWRAGAEPRAQRARSIDLQQWQDIFNVIDGSAVDLQYGEHNAELDACASEGGMIPTRLSGVDPLRDLDDFAALIAALDLVLSVDNSTAHLAAALGVTTWVMLPAGAEWRWGEGRTDSAWYSAARLFRQPVGHPGDWHPVMSAVRTALENFQAGPFSPAKDIADPPAVKRCAVVADASALLLNDTRNWYHFGCTGTSLALHHQLRKQYRDVASVPITETLSLTHAPTTIAGFKDPQVAERFCATHTKLMAAMKNADHIFVNGEGTLHGRSPAACGLLYLAWLAATRLSKPVSIFNHSAYPGDTDGEILYREVYQTMKHVAIREPHSARIMRDLDVIVTDAFDSLPIYIDKLYRPGSVDSRDYAVLAGGVTWGENMASALGPLMELLLRADLDVIVLVGARAYPAGEEMRFAESIALTHGTDVRIVNALTESEWLDSIRGARLLVSGRFHHSIAAAFLDTPLVASGSNTPKISGLMEAFGLPEPVPGPKDWEDTNVRHFANQLRDRAALALANPAALCLKAQRRGELMALARNNLQPLPNTEDR